MSIKKKLNNKPLLSFEIFPPKKTSGLAGVYATIDALAPLGPDFISVTYGAGGTTQDKTAEIAYYIEKNHRVSAMAHLTSLGKTKEDIDTILDALEERGIKNVLALRGDVPQGQVLADLSGDFSYSGDLVQHIKATRNFCVGGACYPEGHLEAPNLDADIQNLQHKVDAGVDFLVSQLFYDNQRFYDFRDKVSKQGIDVPILAGIMPIMHKKQIERITELSGSFVPPKHRLILDRYAHNSKALKDAGIAYCTEQAIDLLANGVDGIHIYIMNDSYVAERLVSNLRAVLYSLRS